MNIWIRQIHRWLSMAFTAGVLVYIVAMGRGQPPAWLGLFALLPLGLLMVRIALEERCLRRELRGYREYTERVRYRVVPGIW